MDEVSKYIPNNLRKYRLRMRYSQKEVAQLLGLKGAGRISEWEQGTSKPSIENLIRLSVIYQTLCDQLYSHIRFEFIKVLPKRLEQLQRDRAGPNIES